jgi:hypothetical protein
MRKRTFWCSVPHVHGIFFRLVLGRARLQPCRPRAPVCGKCCLVPEKSFPRNLFQCFLMIADTRPDRKESGAEQIEKTIERHKIGNRFSRSQRGTGPYGYCFNAIFAIVKRLSEVAGKNFDLVFENQKKIKGGFSQPLRALPSTSAVFSRSLFKPPEEGLRIPRRYFVHKLET